VIDPRNMRLTDWADSVILSVGDAWSFGRLVDEAAWQEWALAFVRAAPFTQRNLPDPRGFTDWREWAMRVYPMLEGST
jgi:hypothetical protein